MGPNHPFYPSVRRLDRALTDMVLQQTLEHVINPSDPALEKAIRQRWDSLTKPPGSLGRLEEIALWYARARGVLMPDEPRCALCVFCADHGVATEGVSAYPAEVTRQMVLNFAAGGAAINVLCRHADIKATIVDVGVDSLPFDPPVRNEKVARGTKNMLHESAMSLDEVVRCVETGIRLAGEAIDGGATLLAAGEMGIGNTTAAAAVSSALTGRQAVDLVGHGTGLDPAKWKRKVQVVSQALAVRRPKPAEPLDVLARVGGFEIAAIAGYFLGAAARRVPVAVDGFIATAAALAAVRLAPNLSPYLLWSHQSAERGHQQLLEILGAKPLVQWELRLGEGTGAALTMGMVRYSLALYREMATFESAGVASS